MQVFSLELQYFLEVDFHFVLLAGEVFADDVGMRASRSWIQATGQRKDLQSGELRAIIGPNGAGKTTFFNLISGFFPPTSGTIVFDNTDVTALPAHKRVAMGMARTFQITEIFPELTVRENLRIPVEVASGLRLRPWLSRNADSGCVERRVLT